MSLAAGIDVGAHKCAVAVCREGEREAERKVLSITTQRGGFSDLDAWMAKQGAPIDVVVMESSGHYWFNLASHLRRQGYPVAVVNPLQAKYFAKSRMQWSKSDPADARTLAALGTCDQPRISEPLVGAELIEMANSIFPSETNCAGCCSCVHAPNGGRTPKAQRGRLQPRTKHHAVHNSLTSVAGFMRHDEFSDRGAKASTGASTLLHSGTLPPVSTYVLDGPALEPSASAPSLAFS